MNQLRLLGRSAIRPITVVGGASAVCYAMYLLVAPTEMDSEMIEGQVLKRMVHEPKLPYPLWDFNWDGRMTEQTSLEGLMQGRADLKGTTRHIILVRHGQYEETGEEGKDDKKRILTELGRRQAEKTGKRLAILQKGIGDKFGACDITVVRSSGMIRAKQTAEIIAKHLKGVKLANPDVRLNEAL